MNVINAMESCATVREKEIFLSRLHNDIISDLWLIYGRVGNATRKEKIALIARCKKTAVEKLEAIKKLLVSASNAQSLFSWLGDTRQLAIWTKTAKRMNNWKGYFENEKKN